MTLPQGDQEQGKPSMTLRRLSGKRRERLAVGRAKYLDQSIMWFGWIPMGLLDQMGK